MSISASSTSSQTAPCITLYMKGNPPADVAPIVATLGKNTTLRALGLENCSLGVVGAACIWQELQSNSTLEILKL